MQDPRVAIKVDVDTDRGTAVGVPALVDIFRARNLRATFLFSLGPDHTGRAIRRIFRPGFFRKVRRTGVVGTYGLRTLLNGVLLPGPHIGRRHEALLRRVASEGHEVGIHCYDHIRWQDGLKGMSKDQVFAEFDKARREFERIFGHPPKTAGAAGWQANGHSLEAYDRAGLDHASDARGTGPFLARAGEHVFRVLQLPTTLPTLDELIGRPEYPEETLASLYVSLIGQGQSSVLTVHAEIEGMGRSTWFAGLLDRLIERGVSIETLAELAARVRTEQVPVCDLIDGEVPGRSGTLAVQGADRARAKTVSSEDAAPGSCIP
ncbi:MAG: polysaccharide deacetylase family protein [Acidiferrobacteraceae bacterium]